MSILYLTVYQFCITDIGQGRKSYTHDLCWYQILPSNFYLFSVSTQLVFFFLSSYIYIPTSYVNLKSIFVKIRQNHRNENLNKSLCPVHVKLDTFVDLLYTKVKKHQNLILKLQIKAPNEGRVVWLNSFRKKK